MTSTDFHVGAIDRLCFVCGCIIIKNGHRILLVLKEATSLTFERSIYLLENVTSSNICHSCWAQRCPLFRGFHIFHNLETSSKKLPILNSKLI